MASSTWHTVPYVAELFGIDAGKVRGWINSGQLAAVNIAAQSGKRPRWRISAESLADFLRRRQSGPAPMSRPRRKRDPTIIQFY